MKLFSAKNGAVYVAGGALAGVAVATHSFLLVPVLAAGVAWIGIRHHTKHVRGVIYAGNRAKVSKEKRREVPAFKVISHARASLDRARSSTQISA
jgi:hypothetical protein